MIEDKRVPGQSQDPSDGCGSCKYAAGEDGSSLGHSCKTPRHSGVRRFLYAISAPLKCCCFYLFLMQVCTDNILGTGSHGISDLFNIIALSSLISYFESAVTMAVGRIAKRVCGLHHAFLNPAFLLFVFVNNLLLLADCFALTNFGRVIDIGMLDIVAQTDSREIGEFMDTYLNIKQISLGLLILIFVNGLGWLISRLTWNCRRILAVLAGLCICWGVVVSGICIYRFARYRNALGIPQLTSLTRVAYYGYNINSGLERLTDVAASYSPGTPEEGASIIFVIGESHSVFHSPLYGYGRNTAPLMNRHAEDGSLVVFSDAVTAYDYTLGVMGSLFSIGGIGDDIYSEPMFPMVFRHAGYHTALYDNQFFVNQGLGFITSEQLSLAMFDYRNPHFYSYDGDMIDNMKPMSDRKSLIIIHLLGQHYTYADRYPHTSRFMQFMPGDYDGNEEERQSKADYDNACLYNDYVLDRIVEMAGDGNVCMVYVSDHGEDVFEQPGVVGHGNAAYLPTLRYQIRVPMFIWASKKFRESNPDVWSAVENAASRPVITDDISHLLMDIARLDVPELDRTRSVISPEYDADKPRVVLSSVTYSSDR